MLFLFDRYFFGFGKYLDREKFPVLCIKFPSTK